jgi:hypothetical protein
MVNTELERGREEYNEEIMKHYLYIYLEELGKATDNISEDS